MSTHSPESGSDPGSAAARRLPLFLLGAYGLIWLLLAVAPVNRQDWFLENLLVLVLVPVLVATGRRFRFSNAAYVLITVFLLLHAYGAHHTYSEAPFGDWLGGRFGWERNHYDRLVHFGFGILLTFPIWELLVRKTGLRAGWSQGLAVCVILAASGLYELLEAAVAMLVDPDLGAAYTGTQGDEWDSQKDMALALVGAVIAIGVTVLRAKYCRASLAVRERVTHPASTPDQSSPSR